EEVQPVAFQRNGSASPVWLSSEEIDALLLAKPAANVGAEEQTAEIQAILGDEPRLRPALDRLATECGEELLEAHRRVRKLTQKGRVRYEVRPELPADLLGIYMFLPVGS
ncbi:MAG: helicase, partial [Candidatus Eisenbacteria sp.]|nr:helicase [Candidatus Eisenbacteria bacterium]